MKKEKGRKESEQRKEKKGIGFQGSGIGDSCLKAQRVVLRSANGQRAPVPGPRSPIPIILFSLFILHFSFVSCGSKGGSAVAPQTPAAADYVISGLTQTYDGQPKAVSIVPMEGKSPGALTIYYEGTGGTVYAKSTTTPTEIGMYLVTFDVAAANGFSAVSGLSAGVLTITLQETGNTQWPDMDIAEDQPDPSILAELFATENGFPDELSDARKIWGTVNPTVTFAFVAEPSALVFCHAKPPCMNDSAPYDAVSNPYLRNTGGRPGCDQCRLYLYGSNDTIAFNNAGVQISDAFFDIIQGLRIVSSDDLVNWTEHGVANFIAKTSTHPLHPTPTERIVTYADDAWRPSAEWRMVNGKPEFYLYWGNSAANTSVVISDGINASPIGPWNNAGHTSAPMIPRNDTTNATSEWLFDPGTMIDHDGKGYMVLGGGGSGEDPGNARRVQLAENMYSNPGMLYTYNAPYHFGATDIWKWNGIYYLNYTTNWSTGGGNSYGFSNIDIVYMMNTTGPMGTFPTETSEWGGPKLLLRNEVVGDTTSQGSLFDFRGKPYLVYESAMQGRAAGVYRMRTAHILDVDINADGSLAPLTMGRYSKPAGFDINAFQVKTFNPYIIHEAETMAIGGGVYTKLDETASNRHSLASIDTGDWVGLYKPGRASGKT